jgi:hypothetical protein
MSDKIYHTHMVTKYEDAILHFCLRYPNIVREHKNFRKINFLIHVAGRLLTFLVCDYISMDHTYTSVYVLYM